MSLHPDLKPSYFLNALVVAAAAGTYARKLSFLTSASKTRGPIRGDNCLFVDKQSLYRYNHD